MTRRQALAMLAASGRLRADAALGKLFGDAQGVAVVLDFATGRVVASHRLEMARGLVVPPGSALKPLGLLALAQAGRLSATDAMHCTGRLTIAGRSFACVHPKLQAPLDTATALAYSCNEFAARMALRFPPGAQADALERYGLGGRVARVRSPEAVQLQALGEQHVTATALGMAGAYHQLASRLASREAEPYAAAILAGMEGAVEFGTAQRAAIAGVKVAAKTGTAPGAWAWFAGFAPSRAPRVIAVVLVRGNSGGADAAPIGGRLLAAWLEGRL